MDTGARGGREGAGRGRPRAQPPRGGLTPRRPAAYRAALAASPLAFARRPRRSLQIAGVPRRRRSNRGNICSAVNQSNVGRCRLSPPPPPPLLHPPPPPRGAVARRERCGEAGGPSTPPAPPAATAGRPRRRGRALITGQHLLKETGAACPRPRGGRAGGRAARCLRAGGPFPVVGLVGTSGAAGGGCPRLAHCEGRAITAGGRAPSCSPLTPPNPGCAVRCRDGPRSGSYRSTHTRQVSRPRRWRRGGYRPLGACRAAVLLPVPGVSGPGGVPRAGGRSGAALRARDAVWCRGFFPCQLCLRDAVVVPR